MAITFIPQNRSDEADAVMLDYDRRLADQIDADLLEDTLSFLVSVASWEDGEIDRLHGEIEALAESNRNLSAYLRERFPDFGDDFTGGMPVDNVRKVITYLDDYIQILSTGVQTLSTEILSRNQPVQTPKAFKPSTHGAIEGALAALSGDLNHSNVAKAKEILKKALKG